MGQRLQRLRRAAGLSQSQLARAAHVPVGTLRNWEQDRRVPLLDAALKVAEALGVSLDELAGRPPPPAGPPSGSSAAAAGRAKAGRRRKPGQKASKGDKGGQQ